jgi:hypothetical protein
MDGDLTAAERDEFYRRHFLADGTQPIRERRFSEDAGLSLERSPEQRDPDELEDLFEALYRRVDELEFGATS